MRVFPRPGGAGICFTESCNPANQRLNPPPFQARHDFCFAQVVFGLRGHVPEIRSRKWCIAPRRYWPKRSPGQRASSFEYRLEVIPGWWIPEKGNGAIKKTEPWLISRKGELTGFILPEAMQKGTLGCNLLVSPLKRYVESALGRLGY